MEYFDDVTTAFYALAATPGTMPSKIGWKFWSDLWYCCMTALAARNQSIRHAHSSPRKVELLRWTSPTQAALIQHTKRTAYHCWGQMMVAASELPSPSDRGKRKDIGGWKLTESHYQKLPRQAVNSSSVGVQQGKMPRHHFSVCTLPLWWIVFS